MKVLFVVVLLLVATEAKDGRMCKDFWNKIAKGIVSFLSPPIISLISTSPTLVPLFFPCRCVACSGKYPTREQYAEGLKKVTGKYIKYTQGPQRWYGISNKVCPPKAPTYADCSSFTTWGLWTAFGGLSDVVNKQNWKAGYTGSMKSASKQVSSSSAGCKPGDIILYPGHVATYIGNNQVVNYGSNGPAKILKYNYKGITGCFRYDLPFGKKI